MRRAVLLVLVLVACGDNSAPFDDGVTCEPPTGELPQTGMYIDPYAIPLADDCVEGGLRDLPDRWFTQVPDQFFAFEYPRYEGSCTTGFRRMFLPPDDHDASDRFAFTRHTWSDGTRYFERVRQVFGADTDQQYELVRATLLCRRPDDTLAVTYVRFDTENGERLLAGTGTRFGLADDTASNMELVGEIGVFEGGHEIYGLNLIVEGDLAYVVGAAGLDVIDVSDRAQPELIGHIDGRLNDVRIVHGGGKTVAFAASEGGDDRVWIIDVTDPTQPSFVSVIDEYAHSLQVRTVGQTTELYLANYSSSIPRFDVTDPLAPVRTGQVNLPGETISGIHDLTVYGDRIYANNTEAGMVAVDVGANFTSPPELGRKRSAYSHASWAASINGREIVLHGDEGMTGTADGGAFLRVLDGDPASPTFMQDIGRYQTRKEVGIHNIEMHGTRAYIAYYQDGVRVVELADPTNPVEVAHYNTWLDDTAYGSGFEGALGVRKVGDYVYVADSDRGLIILREL